MSRVPGSNTTGSTAPSWAARRAAEGGILTDLQDALVETAVSVGESERRARRTVESARKAVTG